MKLLADAALVGFPNAGKSTLISAVSAAKPKIANYPFTTLEPHLGVVRFRDHEFVLADLPGLIEGAADGRGLGHQFLRHVERARVLVLVIDLASMDERSPAEQEAVLLDELGRYRPELLERPRIVVGTKADVATAEAVDGTLEVSAVTRQGLDELLGRIGTLVTGARADEPAPEPFVVLRPAEEGFTVERDDDGAWRVERPHRGARRRHGRPHQHRGARVRAAAAAQDGRRARPRARRCARRRRRARRAGRARLRGRLLSS